MITDVVEVVRQNKADNDTVTFRVTNDPKQVISWCRKNFGDRGDGWDFSGGVHKAEVTIWSKKLITMWNLWQK
jgi:hypothetical protein